MTTYRDFLGRAISGNGSRPTTEEYEQHVQEAWSYWINGCRPCLPYPCLPIVVDRYHDGDLRAALGLLQEKNPKLASACRNVLERNAESRYYGGMGDWIEEED